MKKGKELDALVAKIVMKDENLIHDYSTDIGAAWLIFEKLKEEGIVLNFNCNEKGEPVSITDSPYLVCIQALEKSGIYISKE